MSNKLKKWISIIGVICVLTGCGRIDSGPPAGNPGETVGIENTTESSEMTTEEITTQETTTEEFTTEVPTTEEATTEGHATKESTTEEPTTSQILVETELGFEAAKREILTLYPGSGLGEVGYSEEGRANERIGPESFVVEGEKIYILDWVNKRILMFEDGKASGSIDVSEYDHTRYMGYGNGCIAVAGMHRGNAQIIGVYSADSNGEKVAEIDLFDTQIMLVNKIVSIDDSGVEFNGDIGREAFRYRYDISTKELKQVKEAGANKLKIGEQEALVLGGTGDKLYYNYYEFSETTKCTIGVEVKNVGRWYVSHEFASYRTTPLKRLHVSEDGKLYLMECFEDRTVISELVLGEPVEEPIEESTEEPTKEPTPYDKVLDEYFAKWEAQYIAKEDLGFNPEAWQYINGWRDGLQINVVSAKFIYSIEKVIDESDTEVRLYVDTGTGIDYNCIGYEKIEEMWFGLPHVIRLSRTTDGYEMSSDSWWDMFSSYEAGVKEDVQWLIDQKNDDHLIAGER